MRQGNVFFIAVILVGIVMGLILMLTNNPLFERIAGIK